MRFTHWNWGSVCALLLMTACAGPTENRSEVVTQSAAALDSAAANQPIPAAVTGSRRTRSHKDPLAQTHPTGRRELDAKDRIRAAEGAQKVIGVKPTQLLVDRLREESAAQGKRANAATWAAPGSEVVPFGDDLITAAPTSSERIAAPSALSALPHTVDNSVLPAFPEIRNQGTINSCVAFAVGYYQYTYSLGRLAGWNNKNTDDTSKVSPKWLYNLVNGGSDSGTSPYWVHSILKEHGALTWSEFPYVGDVSDPINYREWPRIAAVWRNALKYKSLGFAWVDTPSTPDALAQVKTMLGNGQVLTFDTFIYSWEFEQIDDDPSTSADDALVGQQIATWMNGYAGTHEATIVGYNDDIWVDINANGSVDAGEKGAFKIANSWGPDWQNAGYAWVAYDAVQWQSQVPNGPSSFFRAGIMGQVWALAGARIDYRPNLLAEFSVTAAARADLGISAGVSELDRTDLVSSFEPPAFMYNGGEFAFDGTASGTAQSGSFALDLSELALSYGDLRYRLQAQNIAHTAASISGFTLIDRLRDDRQIRTSDPTQTVEQNETKAQTVRYRFQDAAHVPRLALTPSGHVAFGSMTLGQSSQRTITAKNVGTGDLMITSLRFGNPLFSSRTSNLRLAPGESSAIDLEFAPAASQLEFSSLSFHNTSSNSPSPILTLTGGATSNDDRAPLQLYITKQNDAHADSVAFRAQVENSSWACVHLSDYQVVYYLNDPGFDPTSVQWDSHYSNVGPVSVGVKQIFLTRQLGVRGATWAVTFRFARNAALAPGRRAIFEGRLQRADHSWRANQTDDWSRYLRRDGMAEGAIIQAIASKKVVFGLSAEGAPGAYQLEFSPNEVTTQTEGTVNFTVKDSSQLGSVFVLYVYSSLGEVQQTSWLYPDALGVQTAIIPTLDQEQFPLSPGKYTVVLETGGVRVDAVEFTKQ